MYLVEGTWISYHSLIRQEQASTFQLDDRHLGRCCLVPMRVEMKKARAARILTRCTHVPTLCRILLAYPACWLVLTPTAAEPCRVHVVIPLNSWSDRYGIGRASPRSLHPINSGCIQTSNTPILTCQVSMYRYLRYIYLHIFNMNMKQTSCMRKCIL